MGLASHVFDGSGPWDAEGAIAKHVLNLAIDDEILENGKAILSDTLAVFIEYRIAEALRNSDAI